MSTACTLFTREIFEALAPSPASVFTYDGLCDAVEAWNAANPFDHIFSAGDDEAASAAVEIAAFIGHTLHETDHFSFAREQSMCPLGSALEEGGIQFCGPFELPTEEYCVDSMTPASVPAGCNCASQAGQVVQGQPGYVPANDLFFGRGALPLSWNFNYLDASLALTGSKDTFCDNPELVATKPAFAWGTAIWFWMTSVDNEGQTMHDKVVQDADFGGTLNVINSLECTDPAFADNAVGRLDKWCSAAAAMGLTDLGLSLDGCMGLQVEFDKCLQENTCPNCVRHGHVHDEDLPVRPLNLGEAATERALQRDDNPDIPGTLSCSINPDPHYSIWGGSVSWYDFQGGCDQVAIDNGILQVQIQTRPRNYYSTVTQVAIIFKASGEVIRFQDETVDNQLTGATADVVYSGPETSSWYTDHTLTLSMNDGSGVIRIRASTYSDDLSLQIWGTAEIFGGSEGMCGSFDDGGTKYRNGEEHILTGDYSTDKDNSIDLATNWTIPLGENEMIDPSDVCDASSNCGPEEAFPCPDRRRLGEGARHLQDEAQNPGCTRTCADIPAQFQDAREQCERDILLTGDPTWACEPNYIDPLPPIITPTPEPSSAPTVSPVSPIITTPIAAWGDCTSATDECVAGYACREITAGGQLRCIEECVTCDPCIEEFHPCDLRVDDRCCDGHTCTDVDGSVFGRCLKDPTCDSPTTSPIVAWTSDSWTPDSWTPDSWTPDSWTADSWSSDSWSSDDYHHGKCSGWYVDWLQFKCVCDCAGDAPCGGLAENWEEVYPTADGCCGHLSWIPRENCLV